MKEIIVSSPEYGTHICIVDDEDYDMLSVHKWRVNKDLYVLRSIWDGKRCHIVPMHRLINNTPKGYFTDHINGNPLDNRRANLRTCTKSQNAANHTRKQTAGLTWDSRFGWWDVRVAGKHIGLFQDVIAAQNCYNHYARVKWGEFASIKDCMWMEESEWRPLMIKRQVKGYHRTSSGRWQAEIYLKDGKRGKIVLGRFDTEQEAIEARQAYFSQMEGKVTSDQH